MEVGDFCRFCNTNLRIQGVLTNTRKIFDNKPANEKSVYERLIALGLTLCKKPSLSCRICRSCFRLLARIEEGFSILRRWEREDKERRPPGTANATSTVETRTSPDDSAEASGPPDKRERKPTPSRTPRQICPKAVTPAEPTTGMPAQRSLLEMSTIDGGLSSHYDSADLSQDPSSAACMTSISTLEDNNHYTETSHLQVLPVYKEEERIEQQERIPSLVQVKLEPPQIKEEQEEVLLRPEEASGSTLTLLAVKSEDGDENRDTDPPASTSTEHMKTQAYIEYWVPSHPSSDEQLLSSPCSESDTEDSDEWETRNNESVLNTVKSDTEDSDEWETGNNESVLNTLKSHKTQNVEGQMPSMSSQTENKSFTCTECGKDCGQKGVLRRHMMSHPREKNFSCTVCSKSFILYNHLKRHMRIHTGEKPFACTVCSKEFTRKDVLKTHMSVHTGEKPFTCALCSKSFSVKSNLRYHMISHTVEKPFACTICSKSFKHTHHLQKHMRIHKGEHPYSCTVCSKSFYHSQHLKRHMSIHTGERPFTCTVCNKSFILNGDLKIHMKIHTGEFVCTVCSKRFTFNNHLKRHMMIHTG